MRRCWLVSTIAIAVLVRMRPHQLVEPGEWSGVDALTVAAWATATVACAWLAAVAALGAIAAGTREARVARIAVRLTPRALRPVVEAAVAGAFVLTSVSPAHALVLRPQAAPVVATDEPVVRAEPSTPASPPPAPEPARPAAAARAHRVGPGENLWLIARDELRSREGADVDDAAVARYWLTVIAANRATLRSGNPNLIFPGELVALPEPG